MVLVVRQLQRHGVIEGQHGFQPFGTTVGNGPAVIASRKRPGTLGYMTIIKARIGRVRANLEREKRGISPIRF